MARTNPNPLQLRPAWRDPADRGALAMIARHPWIMCGAIVLCLAAAAAYLRVAPPQYTSTALVRLRQGGPVPLGNPDALRSGDDMNAYLNAELVVMTSAPVLDAAMANNPRLLRELSGGAADATAGRDPTATFKRRLRASVGRKDGIITLAFDAHDAAVAADAVNAVVASYTAQSARQEEELDRNLRGILAKVRADYATATAEATTQMAELRKAGFTPSELTNPEQETSAARAAARAASVDAAAAKAHADEAAAALGNDPAKLAELDRAVAGGAAPAASDLEEAETRLAIQDQEVKKRDLIVAQHLLPSHPQVVAVQQRLDQLRLNYAASARARWTAARDRADQLAAALRDQEQAARDRAERAARYARAEAEVQRIERSAIALDDRMQELRAREASGALNVVVVEPARPAASASFPDVPRTLGLATAAGALLGGFLAYAREAARCRRRAAVEAMAATINDADSDDNDDLALLPPVERVAPPPPPRHRARRLARPNDPGAAVAGDDDDGPDRPAMPREGYFHGMELPHDA